MTTSADVRTYPYDSSELTYALTYLRDPVLTILHRELGTSARVMEVGSGNGAFSTILAARGFDVTAIDPSAQGLELARSTASRAQFVQASASELEPERFGMFDAVVTLEVIEHVYAPREFVARIRGVLKPDGLLVLSTPYHGYFKNLVLAATGRLDHHFSALWDHGHIKFWSIKTLTTLLREAGFDSINFRRIGRIPPLAKSVIAVARRT
jgi:2-polyprenyl-3-methyl-5-hydroxy-6-metoxy-1,4-benzoquinol methylase